jgi:hypothetical protein
VPTVAAGNALLSPTVPRRMLDEFVRRPPRVSADRPRWLAVRMGTRLIFSPRRTPRHLRLGPRPDDQIRTFING